MIAIILFVAIVISATKMEKRNDEEIRRYFND